MMRLMMVMFFLLMNFLLVPGYFQIVNAQWSQVHGDDDTPYDLWAIWGSSSVDVRAVGTGGINLHYDGNPKEEWSILPVISH
jgi:hypothetical protein